MRGSVEEFINSSMAGKFRHPFKQGLYDSQGLFKTGGQQGRKQ